MSTRGFIGYQKDNGEIRGIYSHWDNYLSCNGLILYKNYNDKIKTISLVELGDISSLREEVFPDNKKEHSFDNPQENVTVFYGRDRGEKNVETKTFNNEKDFVNKGINSFAEYIYLFKNNEWFVSIGKDFKKLEEVLKDDKLI